ncbi:MULTISPECIES: hypothetical protein [unclassified Streptomyces]|uniref:hypothetical protein n=1 Tax=unclassified Streptomyces TaxID=2593676 RepID=UPI0035D8987B
MAKRSQTPGAARIRFTLAGIGIGALIALGAAGTAMADGVSGTETGGTTVTSPAAAPTPTPTPTDDKDWNSTGS